MVSSKPISLEPIIASIAIDHKMIVIHVQIGRNFIEDFLCDGGFGVNSIIEKLWMKLKLTKPKLAPYNSHMIDQTIVKPIGLIKDIKFFFIKFFIQSPLLLYRVVYWSLTCPCC